MAANSRQWQFSEAMTEKDVENAWQVLSRVAEVTLTQGEGILGRRA